MNAMIMQCLFRVLPDTRPRRNADLSTRQFAWDNSVGHDGYIWRAVDAVNKNPVIHSLSRWLQIAHRQWDTWVYLKDSHLTVKRAIVRLFLDQSTYNIAMSRFAATDFWDTNAGLDRRNRILWNKLGESEPVSNLEARERIEELYFSFAILIITKHKRYLDVIYIYIYIFDYFLIFINCTFCQRVVDAQSISQNSVLWLHHEIRNKRYASSDRSNNNEQDICKWTTPCCCWVESVKFHAVETFVQLTASLRIESKHTQCTIS